MSSTVMIPWRASLCDMMVLGLLETKWHGDLESGLWALCLGFLSALSLLRWTIPPSVPKSVVVCVSLCQYKAVKQHGGKDKTPQHHFNIFLYVKSWKFLLKIK